MDAYCSCYILWSNSSCKSVVFLRGNASLSQSWYVWAISTWVMLFLFLLYIGRVKTWVIWSCIQSVFQILLISSESSMSKVTAGLGFCIFTHSQSNWLGHGMTAAGWLVALFKNTCERLFLSPSWSHLVILLSNKEGLRQACAAPRPGQRVVCYKYGCSRVCT